MAPPGNGIFVVRGEMSILMTAMKRGNRWNSNIYQDEESDPLLKSFIDLKTMLNKVEDLKLIDPNIFLNPFLEVIRSEETTGPITSLALSSINKFLVYGLIDPTYSALAATVENIADAVTHARFVGTDQGSDGVVLMKIIQVLRTLIMNPEGSVLSNESVCEIMLSCFRLGFEPRLNDLIRRTAELALKDMVQLLFMRLPQFSDDRHQFYIKKLKMRANTTGTITDPTRKSRKSKAMERKSSIPKVNVLKTENDENIPAEEVLSPNPSLKPPILATTPATPGNNIVDMQGSISQTPTTATISEEEKLLPSDEAETRGEVETIPILQREDSIDNDADVEDDGNDEITSSAEKTTKNEEYVNSMGVRFTQQNGSTAQLLPYGLPCIRELFRFLISLCNPLDKQNTDAMMHMGLSLLTVALEIGADSIGKFDTLLVLVKDEMCRNLFSLLNTERLTIFAADLQVCFLLFESLRSHLKFQLEYYLGLQCEIIGSENPKLAYEARELALDNVLQLWRLPGFPSEIFINYDCDLYCTNLFENITKLLSKTTLSSYNTQSIYGTQVIALEALISVLEAIETNCINATKCLGQTQPTNPAYMRHSRNNSSTDKISLENDTTSGGESTVTVENITSFINFDRYNKNHSQGIKISKDALMELKNKKNIITQGTELFNSRADKGIQYLMENGILSTPLDPNEIAQFLRENPGLDKKMIGEYVSKKKNVESRILETFVKSFDFSNMSIDKAMRAYLESFRLPGEAPLIFLVVEHFADHWHKCNHEPFANTDAAFKVAYSIIMLNMDQHNHNAKRLNVPMTVEDYQKNLRGLNGNGDFEPEVLINIFNAIKNDEIVMPAEQIGIVKENYLWKTLLRRGVGKDGQFSHVFDATFDKELFQIVWGSILSALSYIYDKTQEAQLTEKAKLGFLKCATISSHYNLHEDFDAIILTLCKFTLLMNVPGDVNEITASVLFGQNAKSQDALKSIFHLVHEHGDCMRDGWKNIIDIIITLFRLKLLPKNLMEVEDFCDPNGKITLIHEKPQLPKTESGIFSSLYSYLSNDSQRVPNYEEQEFIKKSKKVVKECQLDQIINETKFLQYESLKELVKIFLSILRPPDGHKTIGLYSYPEDQVVFLLEILLKILIQNRDRIITLWPDCRDTIYLLLMGGATCGYDYLLIRTTVAILKLAIYLMRNDELCPVVLQSLNMFLMLKPNIIYHISKQVSTGMYELLKTSAQNIHTEADWAIIFTILECIGAGAVPPEFNEEVLVQTTKSDGALSSEEDSGLPDRGYISDSELSKASTTTLSSLPTPTGENWILVNKENDNISTTVRTLSPQTINSLIYSCKLLAHSPYALVKCWDCLAFIVRNVAHITPYNFENCVKCIRTFVEASLNGGIQVNRKNKFKSSQKNSAKKINKNRESNDEKYCSSDSDLEEYPERYQTIAIQLLDLMHTLHTRTAQIFRWWAEEGGSVPQCSALWEQGWRPILQGVSRLATDNRRQVRMAAITCLQRSLLVHDLQTLSGPEWCSCFKQVLFPLLNELLSDKPFDEDPSLLEESRIRTATIMSKVFLHHLSPLIGLPNFNELWLEILDYLEKFMKIGSDMLYEAVLESLKNMLLVMNSVRVFHSPDGHTHSVLWETTWKRIGEFLPNLKDELFKSDEVADNLTVRPPVLSVQNIVDPSQGRIMEQQSSISIINTIPGTYQSSGGNLVQSISKPVATPLPTTLTDTINSAPCNKNSIILQPPIGNILNTSNSPLLVTPTTSMVSTNVPIIVPQQMMNQAHSPSQSPAPPPINQPIHPPTPKASSILPPPLPLSNDSTNSNPPIPISHLLAQNQYPSLKANRVPINIAQSFSPVFIQPNQNHPIEGSDIFNDYVNNPYNLTLQQQQIVTNNCEPALPLAVDLAATPNNVTVTSTDETTPTNQPQQVLGISNVFQSVNYFGSDSGVIPPGSEMLFGGT